MEFADGESQANAITGTLAYELMPCIIVHWKMCLQRSANANRDTITTGSQKIQLERGSPYYAEPYATEETIMEWEFSSSNYHIWQGRLPNQTWREQLRSHPIYDTLTCQRESFRTSHRATLWSRKSKPDVPIYERCLTCVDQNEVWSCWQVEDFGGTWRCWSCQNWPLIPPSYDMLLGRCQTYERSRSWIWSSIINY